MIVRHATRGLSIGLLLLFITACATSRPSVGTPAPATPAQAGNGSVTLILWHSWFGPERQVLDQLIDIFNQQNSNGRVLAQAVPIASFAGDLRSAGGSGPHLALLPSSWIGDLVGGQVLLPLDDYISPAEQQALLPVTIGSAQMQMQDGQRRLYGLPISFDTLALFYNKSNILTPPENTDNLLKQARGFYEPKAPRWGFALNLSLDHTIGYLHAFGGRVFDEKGALALGNGGRAGTEQWLNWLLQLHNDQQILARADSGAQVDRELKNGHVLMTFGWAHQLAEYRRIWGDQIGIAPLPNLSQTNQPPAPYVQSEVLVINQRVNDEERRAAVEFLRFMMSEKAQRILLERDIQPARKELRLNGDTPYLTAARAFRQQAEHGQPIPNSPAREAIRQTLQIMQQQVLAGLATPDTAVTNADAQLRAALQLPDQ